MQIPELGVGLIYFSGFEKIVESNLDLIQVIEIEPQTFWQRNKSKLDSYSFDKDTVDYLKQLNRPNLFHGVGFPVGGSIPSDNAHLQCFKGMANELNPIWFSEHLSFNTINLEGENCNTNFLLPPLQTEEGVNTAVNAIKRYSKSLELPFAIETGVNYLSPKNFEMPDGAFVNKVSEKADCNILLDIHNLLVNEKNGRQKVKDFVKQISHERVIQIHLAGGFYFKEYYLDAHSDVSSDEVLEIFESIVVSLPNLKAISFEMLPEYLQYVPEKSIRRQFEKMDKVWNRRGLKFKVAPKSANNFKEIQPSPTVAEWENTLGLMAIGREVRPETCLSNELKEDKGVEIIKDLVETFKGSMIVSSLKLSCRYILIKYGLEKLNFHLREFWKTSKPKLFGSENGKDFSEYLQKNNEINGDKLLTDIIKYDYNSLLTQIDDKPREVNICFNPNELLPFMAEAKLPQNLKLGNYLIKIQPENIQESISTVYHT